MFRKIIVAVDAGDSSRRAIDVAVQTAQQLRAQLALVHVIPPMEGFLSEVATHLQSTYVHEREAASKQLQNLLSRLPQELHVEEFLLDGTPTQGILAAAEKFAADLIVVGTHGAGRLGSFVIGSTAQGVIHQARCPVLVVSQQTSALRQCFSSAEQKPQPLR